MSSGEQSLAFFPMLAVMLLRSHLNFLLDSFSFLLLLSDFVHHRASIGLHAISMAQPLPHGLTLSLVYRRHGSTWPLASAQPSVGELEDRVWLDTCGHECSSPLSYIYLLLPFVAA